MKEGRKEGRKEERKERSRRIFAVEIRRKEGKVAEDFCRGDKGPAVMSDPAAGALMRAALMPHCTDSTCGAPLQKEFV